jgi:pimeloyl-ACP methyl ester carboxylesterase/DNA-binding CsgD family transcriptional regulator
MELPIRFCTTTDGIRIAYAVIGQGTPVVYPPGSVSHLQVQWADPAFQVFFTALARRHTVVLFDRYGCGLSDRNRTDFDIAPDLRALEAVVDHVNLQQFALYCISAAGHQGILYSAKHPHRVSHLVLYGTSGGIKLSDPVREEFVSAVRSLVSTHWGLGSQTLTDIFVPGADALVREHWVRFQREAATPEISAKLFNMASADLGDVVSGLRVPTVVMHRRGDLVWPFDRGRMLAAVIPNARFVPLDGDVHVPYYGDTEPVLRALAEVLGDGDESPLMQVAEPGTAGKAGAVEEAAQLAMSQRFGSSIAPHSGSHPDGLTQRELEVLGLVAAGRANKEIAADLGISLPTVERHIVNLYSKIGARGRADAAVYAVRHGLASSLDG